MPHLIGLKSLILCIQGGMTNSGSMPPPNIDMTRINAQPAPPTPCFGAGESGGEHHDADEAQGQAERRQTQQRPAGDARFEDRDAEDDEHGDDGQSGQKTGDAFTRQNLRAGDGRDPQPLKQ